MAISQTDVNKVLNSIIIDSPLGDGSKVIVLDNASDGIVFVDLNFFTTIFQNSVDMGYASLVAIDGGKLGYQQYLDQWKNKGLIV